MTPPRTPGDYHTLYVTAHSDIWWAKSQQWSATNWSVAILAGLSGVAKLLDASDPGRSIAFAGRLQVAAALLGAVYIARLHYDAVRAQRVMTRIQREHVGLQDPLSAALPSDHTEQNDLRGAIFPLAQIAGIGIVLGLTSYGITTDGHWAFLAATGHFVLGIIAIVVARWRAAA